MTRIEAPTEPNVSRLWGHFSWASHNGGGLIAEGCAARLAGGAGVDLAGILRSPTGRPAGVAARRRGRVDSAGQSCPSGMGVSHFIRESVNNATRSSRRYTRGRISLPPIDEDHPTRSPYLGGAARPNVSRHFIAPPVLRHTSHIRRQGTLTRTPTTHTCRLRASLHHRMGTVRILTVGEEKGTCRRESSSRQRGAEAW